jgi:uncharacterized protein (TIGR02996 family)
MSDRTALLRAIIENPADDTPRLVFADWLDENGEPERAEFVRLQCHLTRARLPRKEREQLLRHEEALIRGHARLWAHRVAFARGGPVWRRGFIDEVTIAGPDLMLAWRYLFSEHPVSGMRYVDPRWDGEFYTSAAIGHVNRLVVEADEITPGRARLIAGLGIAPRLRSLECRTPGPICAVARRMLTRRFKGRVTYTILGGAGGQ